MFEYSALVLLSSTFSYFLNNFASNFLIRVVKEYKQKMGTLKRSQQTEKKKNAQLLEEARKREDSMSDESSHLSVSDRQQQDCHLSQAVKGSCCKVKRRN